MKKEIAYVIPIAGMFTIPLISRRITVGIYATSKTVKATVENRGEMQFSGWIGCTVGKPGGGSGCDLWCSEPYKDLPPQRITINGGETKTYSWSFSTSGLSEGTNWAIVKVWKRKENGELKDCVTGAYKSFTISKPKPKFKPRIDRIYFCWEGSTSKEVCVRIEEKGGKDGTVYVLKRWKKGGVWYRSCSTVYLRAHGTAIESICYVDKGTCVPVEVKLYSESGCSGTIYDSESKTMCA